MMLTIAVGMIFLMVMLLVLCCAPAQGCMPDCVSVAETHSENNVLSGQAEVCIRRSFASRKGKAASPFPTRGYTRWKSLALR